MGRSPAARAGHFPHCGGHVLKAYVTGLCALVLCATPAAAQASSQADLGRQLAKHVATMRKSTTVISFFEHHRWLLRDPRFAKEASHHLFVARRTLTATKRKAARARAALARKKHEAKLARLRSSPRSAICHVFGRYCGQALQVARCESGVRTTAQNGQYLGMFQMGSSERRLFGHGANPLAQARAAYRYFVRSGRDWSPWSCKPWG